MEISLFQLENLFQNPNRFCFLNLAESIESMPAELMTLVKKAVQIEASQTVEYLARNQIAHDFPIVLLCANGHASQILAQELDSKGFSNLYVVKGGAAGLISEFKAEG